MIEILEFLRQRKRMCDYYGEDTCVCDDSRGECPAIGIECLFDTDKPERLIAIVEEWAKEHPEEAEQEQQKPERERQKPEQKRQNPEQERKKAELHDKTYALREKVNHTPTKEASQTPEQKRTNKDVLLAAFPRMVMDGDVPVLCPRTMDRDIHIQHCAVRSCDQCRHEYWLSEVEK